MKTAVMILMLLTSAVANAIELQFSEPPTEGRRPTTIVVKTMGPKTEELTIFGNGSRAPFRGWVGEFKRKSVKTERALTEIKRLAETAPPSTEPADPQAPVIFIDGKFIPPSSPAHEAAERFVRAESVEPLRAGWQGFEMRRIVRFPKKLVLEHFRGVRKVETIVVAPETCQNTGATHLTCPTVMGEFTLSR